MVTAPPDAGPAAAPDRPPGARVATAARVLQVPAEVAWAAVTDVRNHARWVPLTRVDAAARLAVGDQFQGVSGPGVAGGGPGLVDRMVVERLDPPSTERRTTGTAVYRKLGPVLLGTAQVLVRPLGPGHCQVRWVEDVHLRGLPRRLTAPVLRPVLVLMLRHALRGVVAGVGRPV